MGQDKEGIWSAAEPGQVSGRGKGTGMEGLDAASGVAGYLGAAIIATAYLFNQRGRLRSDDWRFPGLNLVGSLLVLSSLAVNVNLPSVVIEAFWSSISLYGLARALRRRRAMPSTSAGP